jgi:hypothetical protein
MRREQIIAAIFSSLLTLIIGLLLWYGTQYHPKSESLQAAITAIPVEPFISADDLPSPTELNALDKSLQDNKEKLFSPDREKISKYLASRNRLQLLRKNNRHAVRV